MNHPLETQTCHCRVGGQEKVPGKPASKAGKTARALPSVVMSILVAFFPKCPMCWAVYMSMFGSLGLAQLPYMGWLLPVLLGFLAIHLLVLLKKAPQNGYLPFTASLAGSVIILSGRSFFPQQEWILIIGMVLVITGSLLNSFSGFRIPVTSFKKYN